MVARAILENPAVFAGYTKTPVSCLKRWLEINVELDSHFTIFHRHLIHMTESILTKSERRTFNNLTTRDDVVSFLCDRFEFQLMTSEPRGDARGDDETATKTTTEL